MKWKELRWSLNKQLTERQINLKAMTLQECKDQVAKMYGFRSWSEINFYEIGERLSQVDAPFDEQMIFDEAAELYASQFRQSSDRYKDLREAYEAGKNADEWDQMYGWIQHYTFEEWLKSLKQ